MKWLLITTIGKNPGDEWIRIGIQKMISEVDPDGEYVLLDKEDPSVYKTATEFDKCIWCGMPVFWSLGEEQNCKIFWWKDLMLGWPSERKNDFMLLGAGSFFPWGRELETIIYKERLVKSAEDVLARSYYVTARDKVVSEVTGKPIPTMICPAVFSIIGHKKSHELKLANIMPQGGHYAVFGPEEAKIWDEKQYKISKILQENDFAYIAHNEKEVRFAQKCGWKKTVAYNGDPDGLLEYYGRCGKYFGNRVHGAIVARGNDADVWSVGYDSRQEAVKLSGARVSRLSELDIGEIADWASRDIKAESFDMKSEFEKQVGIVKRFMLAVDESDAVSQRAERPVKHNLKSERLDVLTEPFGINVSTGDKPPSDKLNIGCGLDYREGFINIDGNPDLPRVDYILEIKPGVLLDHFERGSFSYILAKDFLEHNFHWEACSLLKDFHSLLTNKGRLEIILPNVESIINDSTKEVAEKVRWLYGGQDIQESGDVVACDLSRKKHPQYYCHKYGWIPQTIKSELFSAGFSNVEITGGGWNMAVTAQKNLQTIHLSSLETQPDNLSLKDRKKVLIVRPDSIGDFVLFSGVLEYLKDFYRNCEIVVLVQEHIAGLAESCPYIDEVITFNRKKLVADKLYCSRIIEQLKERKFDIAINPVYSRDQIGDFLTLGSDADIKIASKGDGFNISEQKRLEHNSLYTRLIMANDVPMLETERNIEFLSDLMLKDIDWQCIPKVWVKQQDEVAINKLLGDLQIDNPIVICPFSQYAIKDWPLWKWIELIPRYKEHPIVICGSQKDIQKADGLINALEHNNVHNLCGRITLRQLAALLKRSRLCIGVDTGSIHIAVAVECPQVVIVGGGHFGRFLPYSPTTTMVYMPMKCYGCNWQCKYGQDVRCIKAITVEMINQAVSELLNKNSRLSKEQRKVDSKQTEQTEYLVSAIVSTYNSERYIRGCLEDLEKQTVADKLEIIVVNSGSQQNEEAIVKEFQQTYDNIVYIKTEHREGVYAAWNRAVKAARGKFITNANTDDRHRKDALEIMSRTLQANPDIALVYGDQRYTDTPNGTFANHHSTQIAKRPEYSRERLLLGCCVGSQPMWRKSLHNEFGYFDETLTCAGDWDFWLRISNKYKFKHIPEFLGLYYYNENGIEHGRKIHSLYERYIVGKRYGTPYISVIPLHTNQSNPLVSIIMPAYNAAEHIAEAIESVLIQNYRNFELIIVDDGSIDNTRDIIAGFKDEKIKYFYKENAGAASARNLGIKKSQGAFLIHLDSDDMITPDFIARHLQQFEKHPEADLVYCDDYLIDENDKPIRVIERSEYPDQKSLIRDLFRSGFPVVPFRTCIRRSVFDKIGFFDENLLIGEDYDMMRRFVKSGLKIHHLKGALYLRRMTSDSLSKNYSAQKAKCLFDVLKRFTDTFAYDELFPNVAWDKIPAQMRQLHAKCLAAVTYLAIGQDYVKSNSPPIYAKMAFEQACSELNDCLKIDPNNQQIQQLLQKCEIGKQQYDEQIQQAVC